jgi:hypothetical protein
MRLALWSLQASLLVIEGQRFTGIWMGGRDRGTEVEEALAEGRGEREKC